MSATVLSGSAEPQPVGRDHIRLPLAVALAVWLALVASLRALGAFIGSPGRPPVAVALGVAVPLLFFFASLWLSASFRRFVLSLDLRLIAGIQAWRWAGFGFLSLYANHVLPALFALPAGLGDMAVGFAAPWMILGLVRQPDFAASAAFVRWNVFGILDLAVAVGLGTLSAVLSRGIPGEISTAPMATLPLLLIPAFLVPLFLMLHAAALMQSRQISRRQAA